MYTLLACGDMFGEKINLELTFPAMPTIGELTRKVEDVFRAEADIKRPVNFPREYEFRVARLQIYDDVLLKWVDLVTATQLHEYDQLYAFQPQSPWHIDVQKDLPPPRPPTAQFSRGAPTPQQQSFQQPQPGYQQSQHQPSPYGASPNNYNTASASSYPAYSPNRMDGGAVPPYNNNSVNYGYGAPAASPHQQPPQPSSVPRGPSQYASDDEKIRVVFGEIDANHDGYISLAELRDGFHARGIDFTEATVGDLFHRTDANQDGVLSLAEFQNFARRFPNTLDSLFFRCGGNGTESSREIEERMREQKNREQQLLQELERVRQESSTLESRRAEEAEVARRQAEQRRMLDEQERQLLQKEYELQRQRDALRQSEAEFLQSARAFDQHSAQSGSPRRARMYQSN
eukprot:PhM_4_TR11374/c0_g1_i1/m.4476